MVKVAILSLALFCSVQTTPLRHAAVKGGNFRPAGNDSYPAVNHNDHKFNRTLPARNHTYHEFNHTVPALNLTQHEFNRTLPHHTFNFTHPARNNANHEFNRNHPTINRSHELNGTQYENSTFHQIPFKPSKRPIQVNASKNKTISRGREGRRG